MPSRSTRPSSRSLVKDKQDEFTERNLELTGRRLQGNQRSAPAAAAAAGGDRAAVYQPVADEERDRASQEERRSIFTRARGVSGEGLRSTSAKSLETINADLKRVSRLFLNEKGLPERPWFKNQIYAPGAYTGYGAKPIAAVREYLDEKKWGEAEGQVPQVAHVIENVAAGIDKAAQDFEAAMVPAH